MSQKPRYEHDCDSCKFYGHSKFMCKDCDVYLCGDGESERCRTVVCRFSSDPPDYSSGALFECIVLSRHDIFALSHGLELTEYEAERFHALCVRQIVRGFDRKQMMDCYPDIDAENLLGNGKELER